MLNSVRANREWPSADAVCLPEKESRPRGVVCGDGFSLYVTACYGIFRGQSGMVMPRVRLAFRLLSGMNSLDTLPKKRSVPT